MGKITRFQSYGIVQSSVTVTQTEVLLYQGRPQGSGCQGYEKGIVL